MLAQLGMGLLGVAGKSLVSTKTLSAGASLLSQSIGSGKGSGKGGGGGKGGGKSSGSSFLSNIAEQLVNTQSSTGMMGQSAQGKGGGKGQSGSASGGARKGGAGEGGGKNSGKGQNADSNSSPLEILQTALTNSHKRAENFALSKQNEAKSTDAIAMTHETTNEEIENSTQTLAIISESIVSSTGGRIRLRHTALQDEMRLARACALLTQTTAFLSVEGKARTGSILITYTPNTLSHEQLIQALLPLGSVFWE